MKVALVHDYIKEYGGAERVLEALTEVFPHAPIYTAFCEKNSTAYGHFKDKKIITSWAQNIPFFAGKLHSPLRFLTPLIWRSFSAKGGPALGWDLSQYDVIISSASWYITKGFGTRGTSRKKPIEICYCHTPPRWLYGYNTSVNFQKIPIIKLYAGIIGHFMRLYDYRQAQKVDYFIANSKEVAGRIKKFYRRDATVIYPPVSLPKITIRKPLATKDYYFIVSRIVGGKGLDIAVEAALKAGFKLKIAGTPTGYYSEYKKLVNKSQGKVEFLGQVGDNELTTYYSRAKGFLALSSDEDFGITPVESMLCGTAVIAFNGGGYKETVINGETGLLFGDLSVDGLCEAIKKFEQMKFDSVACIHQAEKFSKERFKREIKEFVKKHV